MDMLQVRGNQIVTSAGKTVRLRGCCIGGWMNMENFLDGYPGAEHSLRRTMARYLGPAKSRFFFDRFLDHFFGEDDVRFLAQCGASAIRIPVNYRHFETDMNPGVFLEKGFERLNRTIDLCARHGIYVIIDMHTCPGYQNNDWHSDNNARVTLFWESADCQNRFVRLWEEMARRYKGSGAVAGYNLMNEPVCNEPEGRFAERDKYVRDFSVMNALYRRTVDAIRRIDPDHIIFLEGDYYSTMFDGLDAPFAPNLVYSSHNYTHYGFGPGTYPDETNAADPRTREAQKRNFLSQEGTRFAQKHDVPLWVGEYGSAFNGPSAEWPDRLRAMDDQTAIMDEAGAHWTSWTYKDVGPMGLVTVKPDCSYLAAAGDTIKAVVDLRADSWMGWGPHNAMHQKMSDVAAYIEKVAADPDIRASDFGSFFLRNALDNFVGDLLQKKYANAFKAMSETQLDRVLESFAFKNCRQRPGLVEVMSRHFRRPA